MITIKERIEASEKFQNIFHFNIKDVSDVWRYKWQTFINIDVLKFEEMMKEKWYKDDKSLHQFVKETYWDEADSLIRKLL